VRCLARTPSRRFRSYHCIAYDPLDTNVVYVGAAQGGVWKSFDGGSNWRPKSDYAASLAIGWLPSILRDHRRPIGAHLCRHRRAQQQRQLLRGGRAVLERCRRDLGGERHGYILAGSVLDARVDPANNQRVYAATDIGCTNPSTRFELTQLEAGIFHDLVVDWTKSGAPELYAGKLGVGVRRSSDGGATWATLGGGLPHPAAAWRSPRLPAMPTCSMLHRERRLAYRHLPDERRRNQLDGDDQPCRRQPGELHFVLGVHPTDPNTVLFGEVHLAH